jgi:hypothetical protein
MTVSFIEDFIFSPSIRISISAVLEFNLWEYLIKQMEIIWQNWSVLEEQIQLFG